MKNYFIFGAGYTGKEIYRQFSSKIKISAFVDNNIELHGTMSSVGIPILSLDQIQNEDSVILGVCDLYIDEVIEQCRKLGLKDYLTYDELVFKYFENRVSNVYNEFFTDNLSRLTFRTLIDCRSKNDFSDAKKIYTSNQYFCFQEFQENRTGGIFIDAGGYVGDTIEAYLRGVNGVTKEIISFEPGEKQYAELVKNVDLLEKESCQKVKDGIRCINAALSNVTGKASYMRNPDNEGGARVVNKGDTDVFVKTLCLDEYLNDKEFVDFIKADVEGSELSLLKGAENTIKKWKPKLAISLYHNPMDFFMIPEYIHSIVPEYKMYVRHHTMGRYESVLYCHI